MERRQGCKRATYPSPRDQLTVAATACKRVMACYGLRMNLPKTRLIKGLRRVKWISYPVQRQTTCTVRTLNIIMIIIIIITSNNQD